MAFRVHPSFQILVLLVQTLKEESFGTGPSRGFVFLHWEAVVSVRGVRLSFVGLASHFPRLG